MTHSPADANPTTAPDVLSTSRTWRQTFERVHGQHHSVSTGSNPTLDPGVVDALRRSLPTFQLGETGSGDKLCGAASQVADSEYCRAIELFVEEEQEHARLLALVLAAIDEPLKTAHWSDAIFVLLRHRGGLCTEVLVLMIAEVVSLTYYQALCTACESEPRLADVFGRICQDEKRHIAFHTSTLPTYSASWSRPQRLMARLLWNFTARATAVVVALDHRHAITAGKIPPRQFVKKVWKTIRAVDRCFFAPHLPSETAKIETLEGRYS